MRGRCAEELRKKTAGEHRPGNGKGRQGGPPAGRRELTAAHRDHSSAVAWQHNACTASQGFKASSPSPAQAADRLNEH